ncbi:MAG: CvpA family protein [Chloroflexi bacterium]|nr:CvpA family protein [Chloroflexota bacterium]
MPAALPKCMNWLDFVILAVLGWFAFAGLSSGILRESLTFFGAVAGVVLAGQLYKRLADDLSIFTDNEQAARIAAFIVIFAAVFFAAQIGAILLKNAASVLMLGSLDHTAGLIFGFLKGFVLVEAALILFSRYNVDVISDAIDGSLVTPLFLDGVPLLLNVLPGEFRTAVEKIRT